MDLQMPVMDGMTATRTIRRELGLLDLPILAFTAGVLETQREAAIKAGLNDFLAKPIEIEALVAMIQRWTTRQLPVPPPSRAEFPPDTGESSRLPAIPGIDRERAAQTLGQDRDFFLDLLGRLIADYANATERLRGHLAAGQTDDAARLLHTLKSNAGNLGAMPLVNATRALETALLEGQADLEAPLTAFSRELDALIQASRAWIRRTEPAS
jgi:HPt (histidine-containing phosphotransfer) domain-containing protein